MSLIFKEKSQLSYIAKFDTDNILYRGITDVMSKKRQSQKMKRYIVPLHHGIPTIANITICSL